MDRSEGRVGRDRSEFCRKCRIESDGEQGVTNDLTSFPHTGTEGRRRKGDGMGDTGGK